MVRDSQSVLGAEGAKPVSSRHACACTSLPLCLPIRWLVAPSSLLPTQQTVSIETVLLRGQGARLTLARKVDNYIVAVTDIATVQFSQER